jgi:hypothetical protein
MLAANGCTNKVTIFICDDVALVKAAVVEQAAVWGLTSAAARKKLMLRGESLAVGATGQVGAKWQELGAVNGFSIVVDPVTGRLELGKGGGPVLTRKKWLALADVEEKEGKVALAALLRGSAAAVFEKNRVIVAICAGKPENDLVDIDWLVSGTPVDARMRTFYGAGLAEVPLFVRSAGAGAGAGAGGVDGLNVRITVRNVVWELCVDGSVEYIVCLLNVLAAEYSPVWTMSPQTDILEDGEIKKTGAVDFGHEFVPWLRGSKGGEYGAGSGGGRRRLVLARVGVV